MILKEVLTIIPLEEDIRLIDYNFKDLRHSEAQQLKDSQYINYVVLDLTEFDGSLMIRIKYKVDKD